VASKALEFSSENPSHVNLLLPLIDELGELPHYSQFGDLEISYNNVTGSFFAFKEVQIMNTTSIDQPNSVIFKESAVEALGLTDYLWLVADLYTTRAVKFQYGISMPIFDVELQPFYAVKFAYMGNDKNLTDIFSIEGDVLSKNPQATSVFFGSKQFVILAD